jgi:hypothetical protein
MKLRYKFIIGTTVFFSLNLLCKGLTGNFDPEELVSSSPTGQKWDTLTLEQDFPIDAFLKQKFHYLGKGHQAFVFASEDGEHVLKLFKPHYPHIEFFGESFNFTYIPFAKWFYRTFSKGYFAKCKERDLISYYNARTVFQKESLTEYVHLTTTSHITEKLHLLDKIRIAREMDPNTICFVIQKRVEPLHSVVSRLLKEDKSEDIRTILQGMKEILTRRAELKFYKPTHKFHVNFGCLGLTPVQLDIGNLVTAEELGIDAPSVDANTSLKRLKAWADLRYPALSPFVDEIL